MRAPAPGLHLGVDRPGDLVSRQQIRRPAVVPLVLVPPVGLFFRVGGFRTEEVGDVAEHEAVALAVLQRPAVAADAFGHEDAAHAGRPHHPGGMELRHLHVHEVGAGVERHRVSVAGVLPRVRGDLPRLPDATRGEDDRLRAEEDELAALPPVAERAGDPAVIGEEGQGAGRLFVEHGGGERSVMPCQRVEIDPVGQEFRRPGLGRRVAVDDQAGHVIVGTATEIDRLRVGGLALWGGAQLLDHAFCREAHGVNAPEGVQ